MAYGRAIYLLWWTLTLPLSTQHSLSFMLCTDARVMTLSYYAAFLSFFGRPGPRFSVASPEACSDGGVSDAVLGLRGLRCGFIALSRASICSRSALILSLIS